VLVRHGVTLPPLLADLFDVIEHSGAGGLSSETLADAFYPGQSRPAAQRRVITNVAHLNIRLAETDLEVRASRHEPYRVLKRVKP
jgi:hypothetical protein